MKRSPHLCKNCQTAILHLRMVSSQGHVFQMIVLHSLSCLCSLTEIQKTRTIESSSIWISVCLACTAFGNRKAEKLPSSAIWRKVSPSHLECCIHHCQVTRLNNPPCTWPCVTWDTLHSFYSQFSALSICPRSHAPQELFRSHQAILLFQLVQDPFYLSLSLLLPFLIAFITLRKSSSVLLTSVAIDASKVQFNAKSKLDTRVKCHWCLLLIKIHKHNTNVSVFQICFNSWLQVLQVWHSVVLNFFLASCKLIWLQK